MTVLDRDATLELLRRRGDGHRSPQKSGLEYKVTADLGEIIEAWRLVYRAYHRADLIEANRFELHTNPGAIHPDTAVAVGMLESTVCATISAYLDRPGGLPLDCVYPGEMLAFREEGRTLAEVGLLADRRQDLSRSLDAMLDLMKHAFFHGIYMGATDLVIGVHPHHVRFYQRLFAFQPFGPESTCPFVNDAPVVGLRLDLAEKLLLEPLPKGLKYFVASPLEPGDFGHRFDFSPESYRGSLLDAVISEWGRSL